VNSNGAEVALQLFHTYGKTYGKVRKDDYTKGHFAPMAKVKQAYAMLCGPLYRKKLRF
jgi:hypothetical protein